MASLRLWTIILFLWCLEIFLTLFLPSLWAWVDPLFLLLVFLGLHHPSGRYLWLYGLFLGFLKDCATSGLFGGFTYTFALAGWFLESSRGLVERDDPLVQGAYAAVLTGLNNLVYGLLVILADPVVGWNHWWWGMTPLAMLISGGCALWCFPRLRRWLPS